MKTPIELFIDGLSEISTIKITDIDAYSQLIKEVKHYEEQWRWSMGSSPRGAPATRTKDAIS